MSFLDTILSLIEQLTAISQILQVVLAILQALGLPI